MYLFLFAIFIESTKYLSISIQRVPHNLLLMLHYFKDKTLWDRQYSPRGEMSDRWTDKGVKYKNPVQHLYCNAVPANQVIGLTHLKYSPIRPNNLGRSGNVKSFNDLPHKINIHFHWACLKDNQSKGFFLIINNSIYFAFKDSKKVNLRT